MADLNPSKFSSTITNAIFANYDGTNRSPIPEDQLQQIQNNFVTKSSLYQNNNSPLFAAQREADSLMSLKQRRLMVFEYVKDFLPVGGGVGQRTMKPQWETITMYINPESMDVSTQKIKAKTQTRGGIYYHHWGDDHWSIQLSGKTGLSGMKGIEVLERIYHHSGTLLRYQAGGPTLEYSKVEKPYTVISFNNVTELLEAYMNDSSGVVKNQIDQDIRKNIEINQTNEQTILDYEQRLSERTTELKSIYRKKSLVGSMGYKTIDKLTEFINRLRDFESYAEAYGKAKEDVIAKYDEELSQVIDTKLDHESVYNMAVQITASYFGAANVADKTSPVTQKVKDEKGKESEVTKYIVAAPQVISAMALQIAQDVIFIKDENKAMDVTLLNFVSKYISDTFDSNEMDILAGLQSDDGTEYNVLKFYEDIKKETQQSGFGQVDDVVMGDLERKINVRDSVIETLKKTEADFYNKKSQNLQKYIDNLKNNVNPINAIIYTSLDDRKLAISRQIQEIREWEDREESIRKLLKTKAMETMEDMFYDEWAPRRVIMYFENRAYIGHFERFSYRRAADSPLISYTLNFLAEKQILGTLY